MSSWWSTRGVLDGLDLEENSIVARVIQAVGLFGDILSIEDALGSSDEEDGVSGSSDDEEDSAPESTPDLDSSEKTATGGLATEERSREDKEPGTLASETENADDAPKNREGKNPEVRTEGEQQGHKADENSEMQRGEEEEEGHIKNNTEGQRTVEEREVHVEKGGDEKVHGGKMTGAEEEVERAENGGQEEMSKEEEEEQWGERGEKGEESVCRRETSESWDKDAETGTEMERSAEEVVGQGGQEGEMVNECKSEGGRTRGDRAEHKEEVEEDRGRGNGRETEIQMEREERGAGKERGSGRGSEVRREEGGVEEEEEEGREGAEQVQVTKERGSEGEDGTHAQISCCPEISPPGGEISCCPEISSCCPETSPPGGEKTERKEKQVEKGEVIVGTEEGEEAGEEAGQVMERTDKVEKDCKAGEGERESKAIKDIAEMPAGGGMEERPEDKDGGTERGKTAEQEVKAAIERADSDSCQASPMQQQQRDSDTEFHGVSDEASNRNTGQGSEVAQCPCPKDVAKTHSGTGVCLTSPSNDNKREDALSGGGLELDALAPTQATAPESPGETTPPSAAPLNPKESAQAAAPSCPLLEATCGSGTEPDTQLPVAPGELEARLEGNQEVDGVPAQPPVERPGVTDLSQQPAEPPGETTPSVEDKGQDIPPEKTVQEEVSPGSTPAPPDEKVTAMDATGQCGTGTGRGDKKARQTPDSTGGGGEPAKAPEPHGSTAADEKQASGSPELNGEATAADDKQDGSQPEPASKYKTVSYRRIRKGNTKQRIDEFESLMPS